MRTSRNGWPLLRPQPVQHLFSALSVVGVLAIVLLLPALNVVAIIVAAIAGAALIVAQMSRAGLELRPDRAVEKLDVRTHTYPWTEIAEVRPVTEVGGWLLELTLRSGRHVRLYQPRTGGVYGRDPGFAAKVALVQEYWTAAQQAAAPAG